MKFLHLIPILFLMLACSSEPAMYQSENFAIFSDHVTWNDEKATVISPTHITSTFGGADEIEKSDDGIYNWKLSEDISGYPSFSSSIPLLEALYNLSLEELEKNRTEDKLLYNTGAKWEGVWTRDVSYSFLLSLALLDPETAKRSLLKKVKNGMIVQDTGSGGSWPISTDRLTWVPAAWEIYLVTGDTEWLKTIFPVIKKSVEADQKTIFYSDLASGESSFLDWREQSYPKWMLPVDIFRSENLGTNIVHARTYQILHEMALILGESPANYSEKAQKISDAVNETLWLEDAGYYAQFTYGKHFMSVSPRSEALGEALAVLFDVANQERTQSIFTNAPVTEYGVTCFWPQIPNMNPYHNNGIWPFVQGYWNWAAAKADNQRALSKGLAALYRAAALFLTNKENMVAENGFAEGTAINSDRQLWSVAANLAMTFRVFLGMDFSDEGISFSPKIPQEWGGNHAIKNVKYRNATLNITVVGFGNTIENISFEGETPSGFSLENGKAFLPNSLGGEHSFTITLKDEFPDSQINLTNVEFAPETPTANLNGNTLSWNTIPEATSYSIYLNGEFSESSTDTSISIFPDDTFSEYQVMAVSEMGLESFLSAPVFVGEKTIVEAEQFASRSTEFKGFTGRGYVQTSMEKNQLVTLSATVREAGEYLVRFRYSNAISSMCCDNKTGLRSLMINGNYAGTAVFPILEGHSWENWNYSNVHKVNLRRGKNSIALSYYWYNANMDGETNEFLLDHLELWKL